MATRYIAFLRGINVGGHRVSMTQLRELFESLAFTDVETFIASGNVIFTAGATKPATLEDRIAAQLAASLGYAVPTMLRTVGELAAINAHAPFAPEDVENPKHRVHVGFLRYTPPPSLANDMLARATAMDAFALHGRELYWLCRGPTMESLVSWPKVEQAIGIDITMRNLNTVRKLAAKYPVSPSRRALR